MIAYGVLKTEGAAGGGAQAVAYMRMRVLGAPAQLMMFVATGILRGCRDTRTGARAAAVGFFVNLVLDLTLVLGLHTGVAGAGAATSISQYSPRSAVGPQKGLRDFCPSSSRSSRFSFLDTLSFCLD